MKMITAEKISAFCEKYSENSTLYGEGQCYIESVWINDSGEIESKLSISGSYGAPYYLHGQKTRNEIKEDLISIFLPKKIE